MMLWLYLTARVAVTLLLISESEGRFQAIGNFLKDGVPFGDFDDSIDIGKRQGFAVKAEHLEPQEISLTEIPVNASLVSDGVELANLTAILADEGLNESNSNVSLHETRMAVGRAMIAFLESRFGKKVIHLGDTSRVSGGAIYGEATVRDTSSSKLRNAHHVFHMDKYWPGLSLLLDGSAEDAIDATANAQWPFVGEDFARLGFSREDYVRMAGAQSPGMLNLWVSLTPGKLVQQPLALLMKNTSISGDFASQASNIDEVVSSMHVYIKSFNDSITLLRSRVAAEPSSRWGFRPDMSFGEALLFPTDRTPHSAVWLQEGPEDALRVSAEIRVLVTDEPLVAEAPGEKSCKQQDREAEPLATDEEAGGRTPTRQRRMAHGDFLLQSASSVKTRHFESFSTSCEVRRFMVPMAALALGSVVLSLFFKQRLMASSEAGDPRMYSLDLGVYFSFQENMLFTLVLVCGLDFMKSIGSGAVFSGVLIGIHKMGTSTATGLLYLALRFYPDLWRDSQRILMLGAFLQIVAGFAFCWLGFQAAAYSELKHQVPTPIFALLFVARFWMGLGGGLQISLAWTQAANLLKGSDRGVQNMRVFLGGCLGLGAGPLIMSASWSAADALKCSRDLGFMVLFPMSAMLPLIQLVVLLSFKIPSLADVHPDGQVIITPRRTALTRRETIRRVTVVLLCLSMQMLRNLTLASLEAGASALLQIEYNWSHGMVGVGTAAIVFAALPAQIIFEWFRSAMPPRTWALAMLWTSLAATFGMLHHSALSFVGASMVLFPTMALSSGLIMARMQENVLPEGFFLDLNTCTLLGLVCADFLGRGGGPVLARWSTSRLGQGGFVMLEAAACATTLLLFSFTDCLVNDSVSDQETKQATTKN